MGREVGGASVKGKRSHKVRLNARNVATLPALDGQRTDYVDESQNPRGFVLRVSPTGSRTFGLTYFRAGRVRRYTIGRFPEVSLADARAAARKIRGDVATGADPQEEKLQARREHAEAPDFEFLARRFIEAREPNLAPSTAAEYKRMVNSYVRGTPLARVAAADLSPFPLDTRLQELAKDAPVMGNRLFQFFRSVCRWSRKKGFLAQNPMETVDRPRTETPRERVLRDEEIRLLWLALDAPPTDGEAPIRSDVAAAVKLLLLLGQRASETLLMRWSDLQLETNPPTWTIPGAFRKGGRLHVVPLPALAVKVLQPLRRLMGGTARVLDGVSVENPHRWWDPVRERVARLCKASGVKVEHFTRHDLRRTCRTNLSAHTTPDIAERVIGHALIGVRGVYDRYAYLREKAAALDNWAMQVQRITTGRQTKPEVVRMSARAR